MAEDGIRCVGIDGTYSFELTKGASVRDLAAQVCFRSPGDSSPSRIGYRRPCGHACIAVQRNVIAHDTRPRPI